MSFQLEAAVERLRRENRRNREACDRRREQARLEGLRLAEVFGQNDSSVVRVWGYGSAFEKGRPFGLDSDLDLAVEGGEVLRLQRLVGDSPFEVELVDITDGEDFFARQIRRNGRLLWERL